MEHAGNSWPIAWKNSPRTGFSKPAYAQQPFRLQNADDLSQMIIADGKQFLLFHGRQFVRSAVASAALEENERAIIHHEVLGEEMSAETSVVSADTLS